MNNIEVSTLLKKMEKEKLNIIDIRPINAYKFSKIPTAINIDKLLLLEYPSNYLTKDKTYYIYCSYGTKSDKVVKQLNEMGYNTVNIIGGYNNYLLRK